MKPIYALGATFIALSFLACSGDEFSAVSANGNNATAVPACITGQTYDSTSNTCVTTTTATATPTPTATPTNSATPTPTPSTECASGEVQSDQYGCIPLNSCNDGYGWYNNQCVPLHGGGYPASCQDFCPAGFTNTPYGCLPQIRECPPCTGEHHGICYWGIDYLVWMYGHWP